MARTFDVRYARGRGLTGLLDAPANPFGWRGRGRCSVEPEWLVFTRLGPRWPFARARNRVPAAALSAVYREGEAIRLEFGGSPGTGLTFWARDPAAAAEIVASLPTDRTVEMERPAAGKPPIGRERRSSLPVWIAGVLIGAISATWLRQRSAEVPEVAVPAAASPGPASPTDAPPSDTPAASVSPSLASRAPNGGAVADAAWASRPVAGARNSVAATRMAFDGSASGAAYPPAAEPDPPRADGDAATSQALVREPPLAIPVAPPSNFFRAESAALQSAYVYGRTSPAELADRWWALSERLYNTPEFDDWRLRPLVDAQLGVSLNWRASLSNYAAALDSGNSARIAAARAELDAANELTDRVQRFSY